MSKEAALALMTGSTPEVVNPSLVVGEMPAQEAKIEEAPTSDAPAPAKELESDRIALVAKKEAKLVARDLELKKRAAEFEEKEAKLKDYMQRIEAFEAKRKENPVEALKDIGFTDTEIFNYLAAQEKKEPTPAEVAQKAAADEITKFKEEQKEIASKAEKERQQALVTEYTNKIGSAIKANPEKYEYANYYGKVAEELALEFATECAKQGQDLPTPEEVAQAVEEYYEEQDKAMSALKKRQPKVEPKPVVEGKVGPERTRTVTPPQQQSKTLTNKVSATAASTISRRETHEQKKARLIEAVKNGTYQIK
jgi:Holliday junction resolvasome RuvABC DNA-binding subunit